MCIQGMWDSSATPEVMPVERMPSCSGVSETNSDTTRWASPAPKASPASVAKLQQARMQMPAFKLEGADLDANPLDRTLPEVPVLVMSGNYLSPVGTATETPDQLGAATVQVGANVLADLCAQQAARIADLEQQLQRQQLPAARKSERDLIQELRKALEETNARCNRSQLESHERFQQLLEVQVQLQAENQELFSQMRLSAQGLEALRSEVQQRLDLRALSSQRPSSLEAPLSTSKPLCACGKPFLEGSTFCRKCGSRWEEALELCAGSMTLEPNKVSTVKPPSPGRLRNPVPASPSWSSTAPVALSPLARTASSSVTPLVGTVTIRKTSEVTDGRPPQVRNSGASSVNSPLALRGSRGGSPRHGQLRKIRHSSIRNTSPVQLAGPPPPTGHQSPTARSVTASLSPRASTTATSPRGNTTPVPGFAMGATRRLQAQSATGLRAMPGAVIPGGSMSIAMCARASGRRSASAVQL